MTCKNKNRPAKRISRKCGAVTGREQIEFAAFCVAECYVQLGWLETSRLIFAEAVGLFGISYELCSGFRKSHVFMSTLDFSTCVLEHDQNQSSSWGEILHGFLAVRLIWAAAKYVLKRWNLEITKIVRTDKNQRFWSAPENQSGLFPLSVYIIKRKTEKVITYALLSRGGSDSPSVSEKGWKMILDGVWCQNFFWWLQIGGLTDGNFMLSLYRAVREYELFMLYSKSPDKAYSDR